MTFTTGGSDADPTAPATRWIDATRLFYELGREVQAVALLMRKHQILDTQRICACGRLPVHIVPFFGARCDVAAERWAYAYATMCRVLAQSAAQSPAPRAIGRAEVTR